ncbi:hypothetical protein TCON_1953 [Astathelohania contejeani]|uniref:DNA-directed RNA polymerase III subunit RPC3 n=1 Tax=Astathelohania contejeani TaxID=164912 RepID=A0ABQ7HXJ1_9MICR|nr:hypothetical protein TCON_1953 [Thelohania contejeani]
MNSLLINLLEDYGDVTQKVAEFLLKRPSSPITLISRSTCLKKEDVCNAMALLIQNRMAYFEVENRVTLYSINNIVCSKRMLFPYYVWIVRIKFRSSSCFSAILCRGAVPIDSIPEKNKEEVDLLVKGDILNIVTNEEIKLVGREEPIVKRRKIKDYAHHYLIVNYDRLDEMLFMREASEYLTEIYNFKTAKLIEDSFASIIKSTLNDSTDKNIIKFLEGDRLLRKTEGDRWVIEWENLWSNCQRWRILQSLDLHSRRIYMAIEDYELENSRCIEDRNIARTVLINNANARMALMKLLEMGLVGIKSNGSETLKSLLGWGSTFERGRRLLAENLERLGVNKLNKVNSYWTHESYNGNGEIYLAEWLHTIYNIFIVEYKLIP